MLKKILIGVLILVALLAAAFFYLNNRNRTLSPPGTAELTAGDLSVSIKYSRPSVRGRLIFGTKEQEALQPYGAYWRLGANESTEITFNKDINFNGQPMKAGTYRIYAIPGEQDFEIVLNSELGQWGAFEPNAELDLLRTKVPAQKTAASVEQYTINLEPIEGGINIVFEWADTRFVVPVTI
jgi:Protein of unknown function (DUF2911)